MKITFYLLTSLCFLTSSCTFYYTTAEIDNNLKNVINTAESANRNSTEQINSAFKTYLEIPCDKNSGSFVQAESLKNEVDSKMQSVNGHINAMQNEYNHFKSYTLGKDKITSKSNEWDLVKKTKNNLELETKSLEKEYQELAEVSNKFTAYVQQEIINKTELCIVSTTTNEIDNAISNLRKSASNYRNSAQVYDKEIQDLNVKFATKFPKEIEKLNASIKEIRTLSDEINLIIASVDKSAYKFKSATKGIEKIYSCDTKWEIISQLKKDINSVTVRITEIENKTQQIIDNNKIVVLSLK
jgi:hypothetical protein